MIRGDTITNKLVIKEYNLSFNRLKKHLKFSLISDIHVSNKFNLNNLTKIKDNIDKINPDYIFIVGDLLDSLRELSNRNVVNIFYKWLDNLGYLNNKYVPVIVILGNHDFYGFNIDMYYEYIGNLRKLHITLLSNSLYEDKYIRVSGLSLPYNSYHNKNSFNITNNYIENLDNSLLLFDKSKINIGLLHSPMNVLDISDKFMCFDLIFAGHMHNGLVLSFFDSLFKGNWGFISPDRKFFPKVCRNDLKFGKNKYLIITGGITKLSKAAKFLSFFNFLFPMEITDINILN